MYDERIAEMPITEWHGARVKISIEVPDARHSLTSMMIIDWRELEELEALKGPPEGLELMDEFQRRFTYDKWRDDRKKADDLVQHIANRIAHQICAGIANGDK